MVEVHAPVHKQADTLETAGMFWQDHMGVRSEGNPLPLSSEQSDSREAK